MKNPPPMPDFNKAKYIMPDPEIIEFESGRVFAIYLEKKNEHGESQKYTFDYREKIENRK